MKFSTLLGACLGLLVFAGVSEAQARSGGLAFGGCVGCHSNGDVSISVFSSPGSFEPGDDVTITVELAASDAATFGMFVSADAGSLATIDGQGLGAVDAGLTHTSPKPSSGGQASFSFMFEAPGQPGAVRFEVSALAANGNGSSGGDRGDEAVFDFVYGCEPQTYYLDLDGDGFGRDSSPLVHCAGTPPEGFVTEGGDCNDNRATTYPGAPEFCNLIDDNCSGDVDENAVPVELYPDADGDGYYGQAEFATGDVILGCVPTDGRAAEPGDCQPSLAEINPGAEEICNLFDDNCDGRVDERVRPVCGEGWCRREAVTCEEATCTPGEPTPEECNLRDDDCDGAVDEGDVCPTGETCVLGECQVSASGETGGGGQGSGPAMGSSGDAGAEAGTSVGGSPAAGPSSSGGCSVGGTARPAWWALIVLCAIRRRRAG